MLDIAQQYGKSKIWYMSHYHCYLEDISQHYVERNVQDI